MDALFHVEQENARSTSVSSTLTAGATGGYGGVITVKGSCARVVGVVVCVVAGELNLIIYRPQPEHCIDVFGGNGVQMSSLPKTSIKAFDFWPAFTTNTHHPPSSPSIVNGVGCQAQT